MSPSCYEKPARCLHPWREMCFEFILSWTFITSYTSFRDSFLGCSGGKNLICRYLETWVFCADSNFTSLGETVSLSPKCQMSEGNPRTKHMAEKKQKAGMSRRPQGNSGPSVVSITVHMDSAGKNNCLLLLKHSSLLCSRCLNPARNSQE